MAERPRGRALIVAVFAFQIFLSAASAAAPSQAPSASSNTPSYSDDWWATYHATDDTYELIKTIAANHSDIVKLMTIGTTYEHRQLLVAKVSDNPGSDEAGEPKYLLMGGTHAREWTTYHSAAYFLNYITGHYRGSDSATPPSVRPGEFDNDSFVSWLVDNREIYILVMVNPDGIEYSHTTDANWRKNREPNYGVIGRACVGTDINRNFDWHWGELQGDSHNPCSETYAGPSDARTDGISSLFPWRPGDSYPGGFSTAEARGIRDLMSEVHFSTALSLHSYSGLVLYPWGYTSAPAPDATDFIAMADLMANWTGYTPEQGYSLYKTAGVWDDWAYGVAGAYSFTIEMGSEFQPPEPEILNQSKLVLSSELFLAKTADDLHLREPTVTLSNAPSAEVAPNTPAAVTAKVEAPNGADAGVVSLVYSRNGGATWMEEPMTPGADAGEFTGSIAGLRAGGSAIYYVKVTDNDGITRTGPFSAPYQSFEVHARNGIIEQVGGTALLAVFGGIGAAGVLFSIRVWRPGHPGGSLAAEEAAPAKRFSRMRARVGQATARVRIVRGR